MKFDASIEVELNRFFKWWIDALLSLIPKRFRIVTPRIVLTLGKTSVYAKYSHPLIQGDGLDEGDLGEFSLDEAGRLKRERCLSTPELKKAECLLVLEPGQFLQKISKLPLAAEENLRQVMAFEMDRLTPFKADSVYFDAHIQNRCIETKRIDVAWALVPKQKLDAWLEELSLGGWQPNRVDVGLSDGFNLLPDKHRQKRNAWPLILSVGLFLSLSILALILPVLLDRSLLLDLEWQSLTLSKTVREVESLREEVEKLEHESGFLSQKKRFEPSMLDMLNELSWVIPDSTWLNGLQYRDHRLIIQGQSPVASSLIEQIEASAYFKNTSFVSPVTKDIGSNQERFQIASEALNGRFSEKSTE